MRGFFREMVIHKRRRDDAYDARIHAAWWTEAFARMKNIQKPEKFFVPKVQTLSEMRGVLGQIAGAYNLKLKKAKPKALAHGV